MRFITEKPTEAANILKVSANIISIDRAVPITELSIEKLLSVKSDWNEIKTSITIPELGTENYLDYCMRSDSIYTLFTYCLQQVDLFHKDSFQLQLSVLIGFVGDCISKIEVKENNCLKIVLLWIKYIQLHIYQYDSSSPNCQSNKLVFNKLKDLFKNISNFSQDFIKSFIIFGEKSKFPIQFRLLSKIISIFLNSKLKDSSNELILDPQAPLPQDKETTTLIYNFSLLVKDPSYLEYKEVIEESIQFIKSPKKLDDIQQLIFDCANKIFHKENMLKNSFYSFAN